MMTFLYAVAGILVGGVLFIVVAILLIKYLLKRFFGKIAEALKNAGQGVPPFRITLRQEEDLVWEEKETVDAISKHLAELGYSVIGDYTIDEMFNVKIRGFANEAFGFYAAVYEYDQLGVKVDCVCDLVDLKHLNVTTAEETGLDTPDHSHTVRLELDLSENPELVKELHQRLILESDSQNIVPAPAEEFTARFADAHAREMDWRVERGGVTADEIRRVAEIQNIDPPDDEAIALVREQWKCAISEFMDEKIRERFLRHITKMSASQWEDVRDRLFIVHEQSRAENLVDQLKWHILEDSDFENESSDAEDEQLEEIEKKISTHFAQHTVRDAFAIFQKTLPTRQQYRKLAKITGPWPADVYLCPEDSE